MFREIRGLNVGSCARGIKLRTNWRYIESSISLLPARARKNHKMRLLTVSRVERVAASLRYIQVEYDARGSERVECSRMV